MAAERPPVGVGSLTTLHQTTKQEICFVEIIPTVSFCGIVRVIPSLPKEEGGTPKGQAPLTPGSIIQFQVPIYLLLHGARVDETPSARGPIADQSMISGRFSK